MPDNTPQLDSKLDRFKTPTKPDPMLQYQTLYLNLNPDHLASIVEMEEFLPFLKAAYQKNYGLTMPDPDIIAIPFQTYTTPVPLAQLKADNFPPTVPINLHFQFTRNLISETCNVALLIRMYFSNSPNGDKNISLEIHNLLESIKGQ